jgi:hypothetical protein
LKQRIIDLEAENGKFKAVYAEIPDFRKKISKFDAKKAELKRKITKTLKITEKKRIRHDAKNAKLKVRIEELEFEFRDKSRF